MTGILGVVAIVALGAVVFLVGGALYLLPGILAARRKHHQLSAIIALNLLAGWTGIGWIGAMIWALTTTSQERN